MIDAPSGWPGVFFLGDDGLIEENQIRTRSQRQLDDDVTWPGPAGAALGGIQIGGTSDRVSIINNVIQGGIGNGITLGSVVIVDRNGVDLKTPVGWVVNVNDPCNPCKPGDTFFPPDRDPDGTRTVSAGPLTEIRIERNRIYDMGLNGIGVVAFFDIRLGEIISVQGLEILGNDIRRCLLRKIEEIPAAMQARMGYGGIALADVEALVIWDNRIEANGPRRIDPVCGIFVLLGQGVDISRNRIINNGARTEEPIASAKPGQRGGIILMAVTHPVPSLSPTKLAKVTRGEIDRHGLRVHDNVVVSPLGRALSVTALGSVSVADNEFATQGVAPPRQENVDGLLVATVYIGNLGRNFEFLSQLSGFAGIRNGEAQLGVAAVAVVPRAFANGRVLFADNQVVLDATERGLTLSVTSVTIITLDDVGYTDNQSQMLLVDDIVLTNTLLFGVSLRAVSNRWEEPLPNTLFSAVTLGVMNVTAHTVATHCIVAVAPVKLLVKDPNVILLNQFFDDPCAPTKRLLPNFGMAKG
jgi:hypothetical protein